MSESSGEVMSSSVGGVKKFFSKTKNLAKVADENFEFAKACIAAKVSMPKTIRFGGAEADQYKAAQKHSSSSSFDQLVHDCPISMSRMHSVQAAQYFHRKYSSQVDITIMNFANGLTPGGGYTHGARAQEECLCRQFPLYHPSLTQMEKTFVMHKVTKTKTADNDMDGNTDDKEQTEGDIPGELYPFGAAFEDRYSHVLYTPKVQLMRDDAINEHKALLNRKEQILCNFVAATAPSDGSSNEAGLQQAITNTIVAPIVLEENPIGAPNIVDGDEQTADVRVETTGEAETNPTKKRILILGAWGCGAFGNDPYVMGRRFVRVLRDIMSGEHYQLPHFYDEIHFGIPVFRPRDEDNLHGFEQSLENFCRDHKKSLEKIGDMKKNPQSLPSL